MIDLVILASFSGPVSLTIYLSDPELVKTIAFISNSEILKQRTNVAYHAVFRDGVCFSLLLYFLCNI